MNELELIKYIKDSIDTVILTLAEKKINEFNNQISNEHIQQDYESMLVKYEQDIRGHIKVEHQLKLYTDSLQNNIDELEKEKKEGFNNNKNNDYISEISNLKKEIKYQKKLIKSYEEQNNKAAENEKKLKNLITKNEKKYKNDIEILNKKLLYYIDKVNILSNDFKNIDKIDKRKNVTISCTNSHRPNNSNIIRNFMFENEINNNINSSINGGGLTRIYRNQGSNISIGDNHSTAMINSRPYVKVDKYILNKYIKNNNNNSKEPYQYQNKMKNNKNNSCDYGKDMNINLRNSSLPNNINIFNNSNNSYILDSKAQDDIMNKFMMNDSSSLHKNKKIYNRHKSIENDSNSIKCKHLNIKKILLSNNIGNSNLNSERNSYKEITKGVYNRSIVNKKSVSNSNINSINNDKNYMNKTAKEININNIIESKNNIRCNFVNNINIYSNNLKPDNNGNNIYIGNNSKKFSGNSSFKGVIKNNNLNGTNYIHIKGNNKNNMVNYRNKQKEGKMISSLTNTTQKKY